jgi:hypothetical protein
VKILGIHEPQTVALKATSSREAQPSKVTQVEAAGLNEDEMALIIKRFKTALKGRKEYSNKNKAKGKRSCFKCSKTGHFIAQCPDNNDQGDERHGKRENKKVYKKAKGEAHLGKEWDSDCSSSDSDDKGLAASAFNKSSLFPNERHTCLMAKEKKVSTRNNITYASSSDDQVKRNEVLSSEISACHETISSLKSVNDDLNTKLEIANKSSSCVEHVVICNRCKDFSVDACSEHLISISKLNDEVASLNAQLKTSKNNFDKLKFARDAYTIGRHPSIKDGLGFQREVKNLTSQRVPIPNKEKGKAPMTSSSQKNHSFMYHDRKFSRNVHHDRSYNAYDSHAMFASSSNFNGRPRRNFVSHAPRKVCNGSTTMFHACNAKFILSCKNKKVIAKKVGAKCKGDKTCIWVPKAIVTNLVGPNKSWVPKTQA